MKKIVLVVLMVMVTTPCFAQEIEADGLFSIDGTKWETLIGWQIFPLPWIFLYPDMYDLEFGFYGGEVYPDLQAVEISFYTDMLVSSVFYTNTAPIIPQAGGGGGRSLFFGIMQPIGIGMVVEVFESYYPFPFISIALLIKTDDSWVPPDME